MKTMHLIVSAVLILGVSNVSMAQENDVRQRMAAQFQARQQQMRELRSAIADYYDAADSENAGEIESASKKVQSLWNQLPDTMRNNIETRHPGTTQRISNLSTQISVNGHTATSETTVTRDENTMHRDTTVTGENGKIATQSADVSRDGNTITRDTTTTGPDGASVTGQDTWTKDKENQTVTRESTRTGPDGKTATSESVATKTEDGFHRQATVTGPEGKSVEKEIDVVKDGNTVTRDATATGPEGKTVNNHDTWTRDGNTVNHEGQTTGEDGEVKQTRESTLTRDGETVTRDSRRDNANGSSSESHGQWSRDGNTVTGTNQTTRTPGTRERNTRYADETDLFGERQQTSERKTRTTENAGNNARRTPGANGAPTGGGRRNR